jgi:hypothetical protein
LIQSSVWRALGSSNILEFLRTDLKRATHKVLLVGPWIDHFFAELVVRTCQGPLALRVMSRPLDALNSAFLPHAWAARLCFATRGNIEFRRLPTVHAKAILIDDSIAYCGSANWYRYSLEEGREIVLRVLVQAVPSLLDELSSLWDEAQPEDSRGQPVTPSEPMATSEGYREELLDPVAAAKLAEVPARLC